MILVNKITFSPPNFLIKEEKVLKSFFFFLDFCILFSRFSNFMLLSSLALSFHC